jgi:hypothetical protein
MNIPPICAVQHKECGAALQVEFVASQQSAA